MLRLKIPWEMVTQKFLCVPDVTTTQHFPPFTPCARRPALHLVHQRHYPRCEHRFTRLSNDTLLYRDYESLLLSVIPVAFVPFFAGFDGVHRGGYPKMAVKSSFSQSKIPTAVERLSEYDDICTDLLIDKVCFWSEIHKMAKHYKGKRTVTEAEVVAIVRRLIRGNVTLHEAAESVSQYILVKDV
jgi:hypothetical protein